MWHHSDLPSDVKIACRALTAAGLFGLTGMKMNILFNECLIKQVILHIL